jgi:glycosyltransferase involved in cell wall biosynthesis
MLKISAVITTYNRRDWLQRAVTSVLKQTYPLHELIVIDDGSDDGTEDLVRRHYPQILYHRQENLGISRARNKGIGLCSGNWIAFLDSDDEWLPDKLQLQASGLEIYPGHRICHTDEIWIRNGRRVNQMNKHRKYGGWIFSRCLPLCIISPSSVMIDRTLFSETGMFDEDLPVCEDYDMWLRICAREPVLYIDKPLIIKHGGHPDQLSRRFWGMDRFRIQALENILNKGQIDSDQRIAVLQILTVKLRIILNGALKRCNTDLSAQCEEKLTIYRNMLTGLTS